VYLDQPLTASRLGSAVTTGIPARPNARTAPSVPL